MIQFGQELMERRLTIAFNNMSLELTCRQLEACYLGAQSVSELGISLNKDEAKLGVTKRGKASTR